MNLCYLGLGSNLKTPHRQVVRAIAAIQALPRTYVVQYSPLEQTHPLSSIHQPKYCNAVVAIRTRLQPLLLLSHCQAIETQQQRVRKTHWGSRTLDIDILYYENIIMNHPRLILPHPEIPHRIFIQEALRQIECKK